MKNLMIKMSLGVCVGLLVGVPVFAKGVTANTLIRQPGNYLNMEFFGSSGVTNNASPFSTTLSATVKVIYGITLNQNIKQIHVTTSAGILTNTFGIGVMNLSNKTVPEIKMATSNFVTRSGNTGTLANWKYFVNNMSYDNTAQDQSVSFDSQIRPAVNAFNASKAIITANYFLGLDGGQPMIAKKYKGFDNEVYGGATTISVQVIANIEGPDVKLMSRTYQLQAPAAYFAQTGRNDAVQGALVKYTIVLKNVGSGLASTTNIVQAISNPTRTVYYYNGGLYASSLPAMGTSVSYSVDATPTSYTLNDANLNAQGWDAGIARIKWTVLNINPGSTVTLNYTEMIKNN